MHITVRDVLSLPIFEKAEVVSGMVGLDRAVRYATILDAPDIADWLKGGEFIITNAYVIKDSTEMQVHMMRNLIAKNAAALGVKLRRFIDSLPDEMLALSEANGFPLIVLPTELSWTDALTQILSEIVNHQYARLERSTRIHNEFTRQMLDGGGLGAIAAKLSQLVDRDVLILIFYSWSRAAPVWRAFAGIWKGLGTTSHRPDRRGHCDPHSLEHLATNPLKGQA